MRDTLSQLIAQAHKSGDLEEALGKTLMLWQQVMNKVKVPVDFWTQQINPQVL